MNRLEISSLISMIGGVIIIIGATIARGRVYGDTPFLRSPDYSGVDAWTLIGVAFIASAILAGLLAMHAAEIRTALFDSKR